MHYVTSDIHGRYEQFLKLLQVIRFGGDDEMYVLGDTVDRGPKPLDTLIHCLTAPHIHLLAGNHEQMMLDYLETGSIPSLILWQRNGAKSTLTQLDSYSKQWQGMLARQLTKLPLVIPDLVVGKRRYYLVHACPIPRILDGVLRYNEASEEEREWAVWERSLDTDSYPMSSLLPEDVFHHYRGSTLIIGHTPTDMCSYGVKTRHGHPRISRAYHGRLINIDCGCANGANLGCLRLEDQAEFYIP